MRATKPLLLAVIAAALAASVARADSFEPPELSGTVFAYYRYDLTSKEESYQEGANEFDVDRVYVNVIGAVTEKFHYRVTADVGREEDIYYTYDLVFDEETQQYELIETRHVSRGDLGFFAKYAYVDVRDVIPHHSIYAGIEKTPWVSYEQSEYWGWRVIRKVAVNDRNYDTSSDLGLGVGGEFANGLIQHHVTYTNGAGYNNPEGGLSGKAVAYRFSLFPLVSNEAWAGLSVNAFVKLDNLGEKVPPRQEDPVLGPLANGAKNPVTIYGGLLGLKHEFVSFGGGYFMRSRSEDVDPVPGLPGSGTSKVESNLLTAYATGHFRVSEGMTLHPLVRYDLREPNKDQDDDERTLIIGGVGLKFFDDKLALIPNYQTEAYTVVHEEEGMPRWTEDKSIDYVYLHCRWDWM
jgi:hypothetical protein